jgi:hypothetical protein
MLKVKVILFFSLYFSIVFAQDFYIGDIDENLVDFAFYQNYTISEKKHFYISENKKFIYSLDESTKKFTQFYECSQNELLTKISSNNYGLIVNSTLGGIEKKFNLTLVSNDGSKKIIDSFNFSDLYNDIGCQFFNADTLFFQIKENGQYNLYKYFDNYNQKEFVSSSPAMLYLIKQTDNFALLRSTTNNVSYLKLFRESILTDLLDWNSSSIVVKEVLTNDSTNFYFNINSNSCYKINKESGEFSKFINSNSPPIYFVSDTTGYIFNDYTRSKVKVQHDTLVLINTIELKNEFYILGNPYGLLDFKFVSFDFPSKNIFIYTRKHGLELAKIDSDDSLTMISDYTKGRASSLITYSCANGHLNFYNTNSFFFKGDTYICLPNIYDGFNYLCKIKEDSIVSIFKLPDCKLNNLKFYPTSNNLYWSIYNSSEKITKLYKRNWNLENEIQATEKSTDSSVWYNEFGVDNFSSSCSITGDNTIVNSVLIDDEDNIYTSAIDRKHVGLNVNSIFYDRNSDTSISINQPQNIVKYNSKGELVWQNSIGDPYKFWSDYDKFLLNKDGNPTVIGNYYKRAYFDSDSLKSLGSAIYLATFDKNTGKVLYKKNIQTSIYVDDFNITNTLLDKDGNIYICFFYRNYKTDLGDTVLYSDWNLQNAILKIDKYGNLIWAKNILTSYSDLFGQVNSIKYDSINDGLQIIYTQIGLTNCTGNEWKSELIFVNSKGDITLRDMFSTGNAIHGKMIFENIGNDKLFLKATYSGEIQAEIFTNTTSANASCFNTENYEMIYDYKLKRFIQAKTTVDNNYLSPLESKIYKDTIYLLGVNKNKQLCLQIYNLEGNFLGEKKFNQFVEKKIQNYHFDVKNGYIVLNGYNFGIDSKYGVNPVLNHIYSISLLRIKNEDWEKYDQNLENMSIYSLNQHENISIFPNPVEGKFEVNFNNFDEELSDYQISDLNGKIILKGKIENRPFLNFDFSTQNSGIYIFQVSGKENKYSFKLVKI